MKTLFEKSQKGRCSDRFFSPHTQQQNSLPDHLKRHDKPLLPEMTELDLTRHFVLLSQKNSGIDTHFYPLGSCTMKFNPKMCDRVAQNPLFSHIHPLCDPSLAQGSLQVFYELNDILCALTGMKRFSFQSAAGAHGELIGLKMIRQYHLKNKESHRNQIIIPDTAHGTNPASASLCGFSVLSVPTDSDGNLSISHLEQLLDQHKSKIAGLMLTNPSTLGLFDQNILLISQKIHEAGGLLYYDGANLNAILGQCRPFDMGFDVVHLNLHKTFATPHGGGGPGAGPVGVSDSLLDFLPTPTVQQKEDSSYFLHYNSSSIGQTMAFHGHFLIILRAFVYILSIGKENISKVSEEAVLLANYLMKKLSTHFELPYSNRSCMHEFVLSLASFKEKGVSALDICKYLIDCGFHPPTMYFPLTVKECLMIEPTETESLKTIDSFAQTMILIAESIQNQQTQKIHNAPVSTPVSRLDEVQAVRSLKVKWTPTND